MMNGVSRWCCKVISLICVLWIEGCKLSLLRISVFWVSDYLRYLFLEENVFFFKMVTKFIKRKAFLEENVSAIVIYGLP